MSWLGLDPIQLIVTVISVFIAGIIRGYSGFGFAMVAVTSMSLVLPPIIAVPTVLILEVLASIRLVPLVWKDIDWYSLRWLLVGSLFATPFGVYLLANIVDKKSFRHHVLILLIILSVAGLLRALFIRP